MQSRSGRTFLTALSLCATLMLRTLGVPVLSALDHYLSSVARLRLYLSTAWGHGSPMGLISLECGELPPPFLCLSCLPVPCGDLLHTPAPCGDFPAIPCQLTQLSLRMLLLPF